ncbi:MAG: hypothetical protein V3R65_04785, partial [Acidiferrobacterales bacterium]
LQLLSEGRVFIVVGMSFECGMDKYLLACINHLKKDLSVCSGKWLIVNSNPKALNRASESIQAALPKASIYKLEKKFEEWVGKKLPELVEEGILVF